jgi:hypothetical protein
LRIEPIAPVSQDRFAMGCARGKMPNRTHAILT